MRAEETVPHPNNRQSPLLYSNSGDLLQSAGSSYYHQEVPYPTWREHPQYTVSRVLIAKMTAHNQAEMEAFQKLSDQYHPEVEVGNMCLRC